MKWFLPLLVMLAAPAWATTCSCEVFAVAPLTSSKSLESEAVETFKGSYYGDYKAESQEACRTECRKLSMRDLDAKILRERLSPWTNQLIARGLAGRNCTGATDMKIPVRVRAKMGTYSLGLAHETIVFLHREKSCRL